jgi:hypothetical protein
VRGQNVDGQRVRGHWQCTGLHPDTGCASGSTSPVMFILVTAVSGHLAMPKALGGVELPGLRLIGLVAVGSFLAYLVIIPLLWPFSAPPLRAAHGAAQAVSALILRWEVGNSLVLVEGRMLATLLGAGFALAVFGVSEGEQGPFCLEG